MKIPDSSKGWYGHSKDGRTSEEIFYTADAIRFVEWIKNEIDDVVNKSFSGDASEEHFQANVNIMMEELSKIQEFKIHKQDYGKALFF